LTQFYWLLSERSRCRHKQRRVNKCSQHIGFINEWQTAAWKESV